ncbi:MAG TPA: hypothetical protein VLI90_03040 [Tepidisphaeraceae bacterium]|nr:hypothetical protein [Tepidisphaeraceae bacterium]
MWRFLGYRGNRFVLVAIPLLIGLAIVPPLVAHARRRDPTLLPRPPISVQFDKVRPRMPDRIVSFHRGRADKQLIRLASQLGFNGVQFQIEGSTVNGVKDFAERDRREGLIDFCHSLGMTVTVWVHEMSDLPPPWMPERIGQVNVDNAALWKLLDDRYEWMLRDEIPNVDGLCLTVVETQVRATDTAVMLKLVDLLQGKCRKYNKSIMVRTFVWYPDEFANVMAAVNQLPKDMVIMSKCVPQDWNLRGTDAAEIGHVGGRPQIIEFDVAGEYYRRNFVANCMPAMLKRQFDYAVKNGASGICVRVDREDDNVLEQPNEVNLWTLGMLADGASDSLDEIWHAWATNRFGSAAADGVIKALKPTGDVVAEMLSIGNFSFGDTRKFPYLGDEDVYGQLHQNWWWDAKYDVEHVRAETGDAAFIADVQAGKAHAMQLANQSILDLIEVKDHLAPADYDILGTRLLSNRVQLSFRAPMALAVLHYRQMINAATPADHDAADQAMQQDLAAVRAAATPVYGKPRRIEWLDRTWYVGVPDDYDRNAIFGWAYQMDELRQGIRPRPITPRQLAIAKAQLEGPGTKVPPNAGRERPPQ